MVKFDLAMIIIACSSNKSLNKIEFEITKQILLHFEIKEGLLEV